MKSRLAVIAGIVLALGACVAPTAPPPATSAPSPIAAPATVEVQILAINDLHGNIEPPKQTVTVRNAGGGEVKVPAGGVAYMAGALEALRHGQTNSITVSAGDLIGASPLTSALFLDEPTILAANQFGLELNAVGNHEFDRGSAELLRMQRGGCEKYTGREPCAVDRPFPGAKFQFLAANVLTKDGTTLFPATALKRFGPITIGFIGMTLKETGVLVTPSGVAGLSFADEAATANALVPMLKRQGADAIVLLLHQGGFTEGYWDDPTCPGLHGDILPILDKLDPAIQLVISGHTHWVYRCELPLPGGGTRLLTSAGRYGTMLTDIHLTFDPLSKALTGKRAQFEVIQSAPFENAWGAVAQSSVVPLRAPDPAVAALVERYRLAARPMAERIVAHLNAGLSGTADEHGASRLAEMIADAQLAWTKPAARGGAQIALMNVSGARGDLVPRADGSLNFAQLFALQPFGNGLIVQTLTGAQLKALLEQQFTDPADPTMMVPSAGFAFTYDLARPAGQRVVAMTLNGKAIEPARSYRVASNSFLASGGDNFTILTKGTDRVDAGVDIDALEAWLKSNPRMPTGGRVTKTGAVPKA
jgi:5'-nucleotidase